MSRLDKARPLHNLFRNILLLITVVYVVSLFYIWHVNLLDTKASLNNINSMLTQGVRATLKGHELILRGIGRELIALDALNNPENGRALIERMKSIDPGMVGFGLARTDGQLVLISGIKQGHTLPNLLQRAETSDSFNKVLTSKKLRTGRPYFFKNLNSWVVPIRVTLYDNNQQPLAVMTAGYNTVNASAAWSHPDLPPAVRTVIMRDDGYLIYSQPLAPVAKTKQAALTYGYPVNVDMQNKVFSFNQQKTFALLHTPGTEDGYSYLAYNYIPEYDLHTGALISYKKIISNWLQRMLVPSILFVAFFIAGYLAFKRASQQQAEANAEISTLSAWQEAMLDGTNYSIISTDTNGTIVSFNRAAQRMLGYKENEVIGKQTPAIFLLESEIKSRADELSHELGEIIKPDFDVFIAKARQGITDEREWTYIRKDTSSLPVYLSTTPLYAENGNIIGFLSIAVDLSENKAIQASLNDSETRYHALFESAGDAVFLMQGDKFIDCNPATLELFGCSREEIISSTPQQYSPEFQPDGRPSSEQAQVKINAALQGEHQFFEWQHLKHDGTVFDAEVSLNAVEISSQPHLLATVRDITERKRFENQLAFQAGHDSLTRLPNRTSLHEAFDLFTSSANQKSKNAFLLLLDLDRFKEINDTLGHHIGDEVLIQIGPRLQNICSENTSTIARLGGDEFAVLLKAQMTPEQITELAKQCVNILLKPFDIGDIKVTIGASIGIACYPQHGNNSHELLRAADVAMYRAKKLSLGVMLYDREFDNHSTQRLGFASDLAQAVKQNQLVLHYQPKIDIISGKIHSFEALVRWQHPTDGLLYPADFIDLVEMSEVIHEFTQAVIELAIKDKTELKKLGYIQPVAINLSARNLLGDSCQHSLEASLTRHHLPASEIELELTESAIMNDPHRSIQTLKQFQQKGINIAIDDFGTGYSSLAYLRQLPINALKIDRTFVCDMISDSQNSAIVRSTIVLAHSLDLKVIAEGVENQQTLALLQSMECDLAQGYGICKPVPLDKLIDWLAEQDSITS